MDSDEPRYATSEEAEELARPAIKCVNVPETVKRRLPTKHYVYKVMVEWKDGKRITIYRKYSFFFDFVVKLNELVAQLSPTEAKMTMLLPELPGRVLFGRSEVKQVAEKRRKKIEEFCQKLIELPSEISQSSLVLGFFNTWPDDTMLRRPTIANTHVITAPIIPPGGSAGPKRSFSKSPSPPTVHGSFSSSNKSFSSSMGSNPISPSSMSPPILSPQADSASALESIISHPDEMESLEQYRVLASYGRKDSHQVNLVANQVVHVIEKHDTGWWMVMSDDEQGYAPASYLEPVEDTGADDVHPEDQTNQVYEAMESYFAENDDEITIKAGERVEVVSKSMDGWWKIRCNGRVGFSPAALIRRRMSIKPEDAEESEKSIYEGLNIHRPPPRRNTIDSTVLKKLAPHVKPRNQPKNIYVDPVEGESDEDSPRSYQVPNNKPLAPRAPLSSKGSLSSSVEFIDSDDHIYEMEPTPIYESTPMEDDFGSVYENTDFPSRESVKRKSSTPPMQGDGGPAQQSQKSPEGGRKRSTSAVMTNRKGRRHTPDDYEDLDAILDSVEAEDYVDMDLDKHNTYIDPDDLRRVGTSSSATPSTSSLAGGNKRSESVSSVSGPAVPSPSLNSLSNGVPVPVFDDDYITMDPLYVEPPLEEEEEEEGADGDTLKANKTPPKGSPVASRPLPPPPYAGRNSPSGGKKPLNRSHSLEDIISPPNKPRKPRSPESQRKKATPLPAPPLPAPPLPAPRMTSPLGKHSTNNNSEQTKPSPNKPKLPGRPRPPQPAPSIAPQPAISPADRSISPPSILSGPKRRHPLQHTVSSPDFDHSALPKTYVAMSDYTSQNDQCLSFTAGDRCVLIKQNQDWWLVNIGGREGWTPGEYWEEDVKKEISLPKPPQFAPMKLQATRKPRSQTVGGDSLTTSLDFGLGERPKIEEEPASALTQSVEVSSVPKDAKTGQGKVVSKMKTVPILPGVAQKTKPAKPPKPIVPTKPKLRPHSHSLRDSVSPSSPPTSRKNAPGPSPSPPPPPLPPANPTKKRSSGEQRRSPEAGEEASTGYSELNQISTLTIENSPWFAGKMERPQAEQFLKDHGRQREFLIRERTNKDGYYALSVKYHYSCKHFNIDPSPDGTYVMGTLTFPTINHIIEHYQQNSLFIHDGQHVTLSQPAVKKRPRAAGDNIRHTPNPQS